MILDKVKLLNEGYLSFNLKDVDGDLYNTLHKNFNKKNELDKIYKFRYDGSIIETNSEFTIENIDSYFDKLINEFNLDINSKINYSLYEEADLKLVRIRPNVSGSLSSLNKLEKKIYELQYKTSQSWYFNNKIHDNQIDYILREIYKKTINKLYSDDIANNIKFDDNFLPRGTDLTLFIKNNFIESHNDGIVDGRLCVILIYLNDDYINGYGGELVINEQNIIEPRFGNIAILDFTKNNVIHSVNPVLDDNFERFAYIKFFSM